MAKISDMKTEKEKLKQNNWSSKKKKNWTANQNNERNKKSKDWNRKKTRPKKTFLCSKKFISVAKKLFCVAKFY